MLPLLVASGNAAKVAELRRLVEAAKLPVDVLGLADVAPYEEPVEDGATFADNALTKARAGAQASGLATLADDSGLEIDVLNRMPGVRSARWAGPGASDDDNLQLVLRQLADVGPDRRQARFVCAVAVVWPGAEPVVVERSMEGAIIEQPRGHHGFGYDPIFQPVGLAQTTAELSAAEKDAISHRGKALRAILPTLAELASAWEAR
ncbi:MAG: RdgB/HAM1 family non-canonical purine NTP pyrophosphatase [Propionibacteriaceae bacterium]|nr:RdgB/HAM1 family non-canonical purine NTP pyrophosphatase [Propionibacteriaceae bacterium]